MDAANLGGNNGPVASAGSKRARPAVHDTRPRQWQSQPGRSAPVPSASSNAGGKRKAGGGSCVGGPIGCGRAAVNPAVTGADRPIGSATGIAAAVTVLASGGPQVGSSRTRKTRRALTVAGGRGVTSWKKRDLLERRNEDNAREPWAQCDRCKQRGHQVGTIFLRHCWGVMFNFLHMKTPPITLGLPMCSKCQVVHGGMLFSREAQGPISTHMALRHF